MSGATGGPAAGASLQDLLREVAGDGCIHVSSREAEGPVHAHTVISLGGHVITKVSSGSALLRDPEARRAHFGAIAGRLDVLRRLKARVRQAVLLPFVLVSAALVRQIVLSGLAAHRHADPRAALRAAVQSIGLGALGLLGRWAVPRLSGRLLAWYLRRRMAGMSR